LHRFSRGPVAFVTRKQQGIEAAARYAAPFGGKLLATLAAAQGPLEKFSVGREPMLRVKETRDVRVFLDNRLEIGSVKLALDRMAADLQI
jgi:hypothetical protein